MTTRARGAWSGPYVGQEARQPALILESAEDPTTSPNLISIPLDDKDTRLTSAVSGAIIGLSLGVPLGLLAGPRRTTETLLWRRNSGRGGEE